MMAAVESISSGNTTRSSHIHAAARRGRAASRVPLRECRGRAPPVVEIFFAEKNDDVMVFKMAQDLNCPCGVTGRLPKLEEGFAAFEGTANMDRRINLLASALVVGPHQTRFVQATASERVGGWWWWWWGEVVKW